ncbi:MAG TPA: DUF4012 domain-containing protein [Candidatus Magasanikbacteria bacterium]|nr:DUF4012 domain-containing protein [Candidatus Magasanikbacteria bacterium]
MQQQTHPLSNKKRAPLRRCAKCDKIGHNARTCIENGVKESTPFSGTPVKIKKGPPTDLAKAITKKTSKKTRSIPVNVTPGKPPVSPHVVSLKNEELESAWKNLEVYSPKVTKKSILRAVNVAELVRHANSKTAKEKKTETVETLKKPAIDILKEIARLEGARDVEITITPRVGAVVRRAHAELPEKSAAFIIGSEKPRSFILSFRDQVIERKEKIKQSFHFKKFAISLLVLVTLAAAPFQAMGYYRDVEQNTKDIVAESTNAFLSLQASTVAAFNQDLPQAESDLNSALNSFGTARTMVDKEYKALVYVLDLLPVVGTKIKSRQELLEAGHYLALGNAYLIKGINEVSTATDVSNIDRLKTLRVHIRGALPQYTEALNRLDKVEPTSLPAEYQESFGEFRELFHTLVGDIQNVSDVISGLELMLGSEGFKRYLVVFQNQYELRPTGGFIGSFGVIDVQNGKILNIDIPGGGSYDLQGQLSTFVLPPVPLQPINSRWEFQDGNWFPDFKATGEKLAWFYQKSRNTTVDGVIAINASVLERLVHIIGPIQNEQYDLMLTSESAIKDLSYEIQSYDNTDGANTPKAVLSVLFEQITNVMKTIKPEQLIGMVTELSDALNEREIQAYFTDNRVQSFARSYGWSGEIIQSEENQDYLMVVNANIGGGKSDVNISQTVEHQAVVESDGSIIDTVVVTRKHQGRDEATLFGQPNSSYIRVYVPEGSELLDAGGFVYPDESSFHVAPEWYKKDADLTKYEVEEGIHKGSGTRMVNEFGKTSFGNWIVTYPNTETKVYFTYRLPFKAFNEEGNTKEDHGLLKEYLSKITEATHDTSKYSMVIQKQSGINSEYTNTVIYPDHWRPVWKTGDDIDLSLNGASTHGILEEDAVFGIVMKQE